MYTTGDKLGKGRYKCVKCGEVIRLADDYDTLPQCPRFNGAKWTKIG